MRLCRAVLMEDIVIDLPRAIDVGEVDQPVAPTPGLLIEKGLTKGAQVRNVSNTSRSAAPSQLCLLIAPLRTSSPAGSMPKGRSWAAS